MISSYKIAFCIAYGNLVALLPDEAYEPWPRLAHTALNLAAAESLYWKNLFLVVLNKNIVLNQIIKDSLELSIIVPLRMDVLALQPLH